MEISARRPRRSMTRRPATRPATTGRSSRTTRSRRTASARSPRRSWRSSRCRTGRTSPSASGTTRSTAIATRTPNSFDAKVNYAVNSGEPDLGAVQLPATQGHPVAAQWVRRLGRPARRRLHGDRHEHDVQHRGELDAHVLEHVPHRSPRRHQLLPQPGVDDGERPEPGRPGGHQGRQPRRVDQRSHDDQYQQRVLEPGARLRQQPAVGSLGADLAVRYDDDQGVWQSHL